MKCNKYVINVIKRKYLHNIKEKHVEILSNEKEDF